jgi:hypothetical protein
MKAKKYADAAKIFTSVNMTTPGLLKRLRN